MANSVITGKRIVNVTLKDMLNPSNTAFRKISCNGMTTIEGQLYVNQAISAGSWVTVGTINEDKPSTTIHFPITTYDGNGIGYGKLLVGGQIQICNMTALTALGQIFFNFSY